LVAFAAAISWLYGVAAPKASVAWSTWWVQLITVTLTVTAAAALFQVREYWPKAYAALEALVGLTAAWIALSKNSPIEVGIALAAAVYLMVRAQDNLRRQAKDRTSSKGTPSAAPIEDLGVRS
jgi:hypothetical protein